MIKLYEGCWGVTRGGEKRGPMVPNLRNHNIGKWTDNAQALCDQSRPFWFDDGKYWPMKTSDHDIIAVFATEPEADAYLAGEKPAEAPKFPEVGSSFDFRRQDGTWIKVCVVPDATSVPQPVTWPDGVFEVHMDDGTAICVSGGSVGLRLPGQDSYTIGSNPRQLAALLLAAADQVEARG